MHLFFEMWFEARFLSPSLAEGGKDLVSNFGGKTGLNGTQPVPKREVRRMTNKKVFVFFALVALCGLWRMSVSNTEVQMLSSEPCNIAHGAPGCGDPVIQAAVCEFRPSCCKVGWGQNCAAMATWQSLNHAIDKNMARFEKAVDGE
ncbi:MAG: hypothetical protein AAB691_00035 [Patescibacteria group bacterium]